MQSYAAPAQSSSPMTGAPAKKWEPYGGGYDPKNRRVPAPSSLPAESYDAPSQSHPASASAAAPMTSAPAKKWEPYGGGYDPLSRRAPAASNVPAQSYQESYAAPAQSHSEPAAAPMTIGSQVKHNVVKDGAKKWEPYGGGYDPLNRRAPAASSVPAQSFAAPAQSYAAPAVTSMSSAPAKKWAPYNSAGYDPQTRRSSNAPEYATVDSPSAAEPTAATLASKWVAPSGYMPSSRPAAPAPAPMTNMPEKKWEPYAAGYDPKNRRDPRPKLASASPPPTQSYSPPAGYVPSVPSVTTPASSTPDKKWKPSKFGYDPKKRTSATASSESVNARPYLNAQIQQLNANLSLPHKNLVAATKRSDEIFNILFNCLVLAQALCQAVGGRGPAPRFPGQLLTDFVSNGLATVERFFTVASLKVRPLPLF